MRNILTFIIAILTIAQIQAQELNAKVTVNFPKLQVADPQVIQKLENVLNDFINNQAWTDQKYKPEEKIECNFILNINEELSATSFKGDLQIQALRPTYGSNYKTILFNHADKDVSFEFSEYAPVEFSENTYASNISSLLAYYTYIIIGLDKDSYQPYAGEQFFQKAQDIVNSIPSNVASTYTGWRALDGGSNVNRYWLVENMLNPRVLPFRLAFYNYHRKSLDTFGENILNAQEILSKSIQQVQETNLDYPNSMIITVFVNSKREEIIEIFKGAPKQLKTPTYKNMIRLDAANASQYRAIR